MENLEEAQKIIRMTLIRIGIKCDMKGFFYLAKATELVLERPMLVYDLRRLVEEVAKIFKVDSVISVESSMQNAITTTYKEKGFDAVNTLYNMEVFKPKYKPNTAEIIKLVAEYYNLGLYKEES